MADYRRNPYNRQSCCTTGESGRQSEMMHRSETMRQCESMRQAESMAQQTQTASSCPMPYSTMDMDRFPVAMLYVPWQKWNQTYELDRGLKAGTIFPELDKPFRGIRKGGCMK